MKKPTFTKMTSSTGVMNAHTNLLYGFNQHLQGKGKNVSKPFLCVQLAYTMLVSLGDWMYP